MKRNLIRLAGVLVLLTVLFVALGWSNPNALDKSNLFDVFNRHGALGNGSTDWALTPTSIAQP